MDKKERSMNGMKKKIDHENLCTLPPLKFRRHSRSQEYTKKTFDFSSYYSDHFHYFYVTLHILDRPNLSFFCYFHLTHMQSIHYGIACAFIPHISSSLLFVFFLHHSNISQFSCTFALY